MNIPLVTPLMKQPSRAVIKSASISGLSLMIPADLDTAPQPVQSPGGGSSTASSRDTSPCRELSPLVTSLKPPIIIRRGPRGFGFTVHTVRVYYGDTDFYTMHHLVMVIINNFYFSFLQSKINFFIMASNTYCYKKIYLACSVGS